MIAKLVSVNVRTVYDKKVVRVTVDIPYETIQDATLEGKDALQYLNHRVDKHLGINITNLEDQDQELIEEHA